MAARLLAASAVRKGQAVMVRRLGQDIEVLVQHVQHVGSRVIIAWQDGQGLGGSNGFHAEDPVRVTR